LVARQLQLLLVEHCNRWGRLRQGGTRTAVKKSVRLPAKRKGTGPRRRWTKSATGSGSTRPSWARVRACELGHYRVVSCRLVTGGTALSPSGLLVVCRADSPAVGVTLQTMVWVTTGGECVDTVCRLQTKTSRESVRKAAEAGPRLYEVHQPSMRMRFRRAVRRKDRTTCTMRIAVSNSSNQLKEGSGA